MKRIEIPLALLAVLFVSGCVADLDDVATGSVPAQPPLATYACEDGSQLKVAATGASVVVEAQGEEDPVALPASPPNQFYRFAEGLYSLVVENGEALWMKNGEGALACRA
ncbi:MAG: hypothetical protein ACK4R3_07020 [Aliihoeflea sp.]